MKDKSRAAFRQGVLGRDGNKCVVCGNAAQDAHHLMERRLFDNGGYTVNNGVALCGPCHLLAESTAISPTRLRELAGLNVIVLPEHMYGDYEYTKWGDIINADGTRYPGELFYDPSVQKVIAPFLHLYRTYIKYPRTFHLPWSPGAQTAVDDRILKDLAKFYQHGIIGTLKMDGENTTLYSDGYMHARSIDEGGRRMDRSWVKQFWSQRFFDLPEGWRVCGENVFAKHSIKYDALESYFYGFQIWNEQNICLSWAETLEWFELLGITPVSWFYHGAFDPNLLQKEYEAMVMGREHEGYVIRIADSFTYKQFRKSVAKWVRENHVQTAKHWFAGQRLEKNELSGNKGIGS